MSGQPASKKPDGTVELAAPVTVDDADRRYGPGRHAARERYDELSMRDHLARAHATLQARGEYDPARHGPDDAEPLTTAEHLELLAAAEYLSRAYKPSVEVDLRAAGRGQLAASRRRAGHRRGIRPGGVPRVG